MAETQTTAAKTTQTQTAKAKPEPQEEVASQAQLSELEKLVMDSSLDGQGDALGDPKIQTSQRQHMARRIGQVQGNRHLQGVVMLSRLNTGVVQRQPAGGAGGGGLPPASPVQVQHAKAVEALKKSYNGSIAENGSVEEKSLDEFHKWYDAQMKGKTNPDTNKPWEDGDSAKRERVFGVQYGDKGNIVIPILPMEGGQDPNADNNRISTIAHEVLHANSKFSGAVPKLVDETTTEFLALKACQAAGINPSISKYSNAMDTFYALAKVVGGTGVMQDAYFSGAAGIQTAFDAAKGAGAWEFFANSMNTGKLADAREILVEGTRGALFKAKKKELNAIVDAVWITDGELEQFRQGWGELLKAEKDVCRPFFTATVERATVMRESRRESLLSTMAT